MTDHLCSFCNINWLKGFSDSDLWCAKCNRRYELIENKLFLKTELEKEKFEERAAIIEFEGGLSKYEAEIKAKNEKNRR